MDGVTLQRFQDDIEAAGQPATSVVEVLVKGQSVVCVCSDGSLWSAHLQTNGFDAYVTNGQYGWSFAGAVPNSVADRFWRQRQNE